MADQWNVEGGTAASWQSGSRNIGSENRWQTSSDDNRLPHAPPSRSLPESPDDVASRLIADVSSEVEDDQVWEHYAQVLDQVRVHLGSATLSGRLAVHRGAVCQVVIDAVNGGNSGLGLRAKIIDCDSNWLQLRQDADEAVGFGHWRPNWMVKLGAIESITGLSWTVDSSPDDPDAASLWLRQLRHVQDRGETVVVHRRRRHPMVGTIEGVAADHVDLRLSPDCESDLPAADTSLGSQRTPSASGTLLTHLPHTSIAAVQWR